MSNIDILSRKRKRAVALEDNREPVQNLDKMPSKKSNKGKKSEKVDGKAYDSDEAFEKLLQDESIKTDNPTDQIKAQLKCSYKCSLCITNV